MYLMQRNILAPKNTDVDEVNNVILESISEELHTYLSANSLTPTKKVQVLLQEFQWIHCIRWNF
jgi:hypothetical protein